MIEFLPRTAFFCESKRVLMFLKEKSSLPEYASPISLEIILIFENWCTKEIIAVLISPPGSSFDIIQKWVRRNFEKTLMDSKFNPYMVLLTFEVFTHELCQYLIILRCLHQFRDIDANFTCWHIFFLEQNLPFSNSLTSVRIFSNENWAALSTHFSSEANPFKSGYFVLTRLAR